METNQTSSEQPAISQEPSFVKTPEDRQMLAEIYELTKKTHRYLKWQMYITIVLVVLPLLAVAFILPMVLKNLSGVYGGLLQ